MLSQSFVTVALSVDVFAAIWVLAFCLMGLTTLILTLLLLTDVDIEVSLESAERELERSGARS